MTEIASKIIPANIFNLKIWVNNSTPEELKTTFTILLKKAGFNSLKFTETYFPEQGYTAFWLLAESHLAVHTFPQDDCSYIELSSCNKSKTEVFRELLSKMNYTLLSEATIEETKPVTLSLKNVSHV